MKSKKKANRVKKHNNIKMLLTKEKQGQMLSIRTYISQAGHKDRWKKKCFAKFKKVTLCDLQWPFSSNLI